MLVFKSTTPEDLLKEVAEYIRLRAVQEGYHPQLHRTQTARKVAEASARALEITAGHLDAAQIMPPATTPAWAGCTRAAGRLADLVCAMYHRGDEKSRQVFPTATWSELIANELGIATPNQQAEGEDWRDVRAARDFTRD